MRDKDRPGGRAVSGLSGIRAAGRLASHPLAGFPFDLHAYDEVAPALAARGARVIVPYLRGFGATRFLAADTLCSGQQSALGQDALVTRNSASG